MVLVAAPGAVQRGWFAGDVAGAVQRGWFAGDVVGAGWTTDAGEETHGCRCTASGAGGEIDMAKINGDGDNNLKKVTHLCGNQGRVLQDSSEVQSEHQPLLSSIAVKHPCGVWDPLLQGNNRGSMLHFLGQLSTPKRLARWLKYP
ncbi:hypothetical protein NC653_037329 [Populus alba x Populus x berolinensis]|uniref:Uncharacterized protein n=1 Tax=Populus alba x Populus x berolinensis TaxID=444605 RepID=A0AAD6LE60_9ROSI|nr:hypothetical protein NC653_037329 [Populus alba x Populus x berolinensis]